MRHTTRLSCLLLALLAAPVLTVGGLELREGRIKLVLHEDLGRFSVYYLADVQSEVYVPLFVDADPRTSTTTLLVDNRIYRLGESGELQQATRRTEEGAEFSWTSRVLAIRQAFSFVTSAGSQLADGVRVTLTVQNQGEQVLQIGVRQLLDTYLAESATAHFSADGQRPITRETELTGATRPAFWSSARPSDTLSLFVLTTGQGIDTPERIVFANWKRLNDSSWAFQSSASRTFSNLPYSVNDSAVAAYYGPRSVSAGATLTVGTVLGASTVGSFIPKTAEVAAGAPMTGTEILTAIASTTGIADPTLAANTDLGVLNDLIKTIESRIPNAATLTESDLKALADALRELSTRIDQYVGTRRTASP